MTKGVGNMICLESHLLLDLSNSQTGVEALGAGSGAVQDSVASVQAHRVVESSLARLGSLITGVNNPSVRLQENGGS
jgi:hypothetical protein